MTSCDLSENADDAPVVRPKRRWWRLQFGLRTLFVGMVVLAGVGGIGARWIDWSKRQQSIKRLIAEGYDLDLAPVSEPFQIPGLPGPEPPETWDMVVGVNSSPLGLGSVTPEALNVIARLPNLERLTIVYYDSELIPALASWRSLRHLYLHGKPLKAEDAKRIAECEFLTSLAIQVDLHSSKELGVLDRLKHLRSLRASGQVNDEVLQSWQGMIGLEELILENCSHLSDRALAELIGRNPSLQHVELLDATCTAEVCRALSQCKSLTKLQLIDCKLDDEARAELRAATQVGELEIRPRTWPMPGSGLF